MKSVLYLFLNGFISMNITAASWLTAFFGFGQGFWMSSLWGAAGGIFGFSVLQWVQKRKILQDNGLTSKEYRYIKSNMKEAREKIKRLNKSIFSARSINAARQIRTLQKTAGKIYQVVRSEPRRFFQAERFFFYHLDSVVELTDRYTFLSKQKIKDRDVRVSLSETERTLEKLTKSVENDLVIVVSNDIDHLNTELDVAKLTINRDNHLLLDERGKKYE
ncbi:5-bromo-4-chloroindolyl phosphate hydrolysis family protein [Bacillus marinisedimentorum]|uniref:5-bromo-4-chloroindolyl phosphate hydrolysis family protein n=1 Tax=Bacillus marinisedimentorum TaxID=1821260 RepID=UPI000871C243|nr:5-bromo-4-chloroindolyl phosphate hydrolysis family protein [Bacillus marinisedimentorum]